MLEKIKFAEKEVELTKPLAVEVTLTNTSDRDMRLLRGVRGVKLWAYSADGWSYVEVSKANGMTAGGFYIPTIKAGESKMVIRKIKLDRLSERNLRGKDILSRALQVVQLEPGDYKVGVQPFFGALSRDPNDSLNKGMYVGSPGLVQISFTLEEAK